jgi:hypothetical protein
MAEPLSEATVEQLLVAYAKNPSYRAVSAELGLTYRVVRKYVKQHQKRIDTIRKGSKLLVEPKQPPPDPVETTRLALERSRALKTEKSLLFDVAGEHSLRRELAKLARETAKAMPPPPRFKSRAAPRAVTETGLLLFSDWHAYEVVKKHRVQDLNEYNAEVFARRVKRVVDQVIDRKRRMEAGGVWSIPELVVSCNGDFVSGTIHDAERHMDAPNITMAVYGCGMTLAAAIRDLSAYFAKVTVICTSGNHGRLPDARKVQSKDPTRNWDTLIYLLAETHLASCPNVRFVIPDSYVVSFNIGSKRFVQYHGHGIKSWNQIPHYGIGRWTRNNQAMRSQTGEPVDYYLISHFHADSSIPSPRGKTYINGSLIGGNEYSVDDLGGCEPPSQRFFLVSDPVGVTEEVPMYGELPGEAPGNSYPVYPWERHS